MPPDALLTDAIHSSIAFCSGWDGGTQCDRRSATGLSCATAVKGRAHANVSDSKSFESFIRSSHTIAPEGAFVCGKNC